MKLQKLILTLVREPLVHFLSAGLVLFLFMGDRADPASRTIVIDERRVASLAVGFAQSWQRVPTPNEIDGLIREHVKDEVYYREAKRLGLDEDDPVVRRRMRTKMEFLVRSEVEALMPSDADLQRVMDASPARYAKGARFSFEQEFSGGALSLPRSMARADAAEIDQLFGEGFAAQLARLPKGQWATGVKSGLGLHKVRVVGTTPGAPARLSEVRRMVENDWRAQNLKAREKRALDALLKDYDIRIDQPK